MYNILICDDEKDIVKALKIYLYDENYTIYEAYNGKEALQLVNEIEFHAILMDIMMPVMDGIQAMMEIRKISNVPILMLSAKSEDTDKILGLNIGADDYITKPFNPVEVVARVKSQLRRYTKLGASISEEDSLIIGNIHLDDSEKKVRVDGNEVSLTPTEFDILKLLMSHPNRVFAPKQIYEQVWKDYGFASENTVAVHIRHLREKIEINPSEPRYLKVVWGQGYKLEKE